MSDHENDLARYLHRIGLGSIAAVVLEGLAPLAPLGAQGMYLLQPLFGAGEAWQRVASSLEDPEHFYDLVAELRRGDQHAER